MKASVCNFEEQHRASEYSGEGLGLLGSCMIDNNGRRGVIFRCTTYVYSLYSIMLVNE